MFRHFQVSVGTYAGGNRLLSIDPEQGIMMTDQDFSEEEYRKRLANVRKRMADRGVDLLVVDQFEHLVYLFGYLPTAAKYQACLLPLDGEPHMIVRSMDCAVFRNQSWLTSWREFSDAEDPVAVACDEIALRYGSGLRIGMEFDSHILTVGRYRQFRTLCPGSDILDFSGEITELRLLKSPAELSYLRRAARIADECMAAAVEVAGAGICEREAAAAAYATAMRAGADNGRVLLGASGKQTDSIHGRLGVRMLEEGDVLHLEMVPQVRGYSARVMRPTFIGRPDPEAAHLARRMIEIQNQQIAAMAPGMTGGEIDAIARDQLLNEKLCSSYANHTGYTLGYHAQPRTSEHTRIFIPSAKWVLMPGMVFHMFMAVQGIGFGDTVLVTETGHERLTRTPRDSFLR